MAFFGKRRIKSRKKRVAFKRSRLSRAVTSVLKTRSRMRARRRRRRNRVSFPRPTGVKKLGFMKTTVTVPMHFVRQFTIPTTSGTIIRTFDISCNNVFSPVGGGDQPFGRDEVTDFYGRYEVLSAHLRIKPVENDASVTVPPVWGVVKTFSTENALPDSAVLRLESLLEQYKCRWYQTGSRALEVNGRKPQWKHYYCTKNEIVKYYQSDPRDYEVAKGQNPVEVANWTVFCASPDATVTTAPMAFVAEVMYKVKWSDPEPQAVS